MRVFNAFRHIILNHRKKLFDERLEMIKSMRIEMRGMKREIRLLRKELF